ncbi:MAG: hypothetical protein AAGJ79_06665 [Verrucomicrobiota bacterium]
MKDEFEPQPIPEILHSEYLEAPFRVCTRCGESLGDFDDGYQIVKTYKAGEVIMEYALCGPCAMSLLDEYSEETRQNMERFFAENYVRGLGLGKCGLCQDEEKLEGRRANEFALVGACLGHEMFDSMRACSVCMEKTNELVSKKTRDVWRDFIDNNFPGVPESFAPEPVGIFV